MLCMQSFIIKGQLVSEIKRLTENDIDFFPLGKDTITYD